MNPNENSLLVLKKVLLLQQFMARLINITKEKDISPAYKETPIGQLLEYHNLGRKHNKYEQAQIIIGMCMDYRMQLRIPEKYAYIIRSAGANMANHDFSVSYAIAVGKIKHIALIGHNNCGMSNIVERKEKFIQGLIETAGWDREQAEEQFFRFEPKFEIGNEQDFVLKETKRLRLLYPKIIIAPLIYSVEDHKLYLIEESKNDIAASKQQSFVLEKQENR